MHLSLERCGKSIPPLPPNLLPHIYYVSKVTAAHTLKRFIRHSDYYKFFNKVK